MARILISWIATKNDFIEGGNVPNPDGPNSLVHKHFYNFDSHLILSSQIEGMDTRFEFLVNYLKRTYKHDIQEYYMNLNDVIDLREIKAKVEKLLLINRKDEIEIFISPGTPAMQVAWYFAHFQLGLNTKLFQTRPGKYTKTKKPEKIYIDLEQSNFTSALIIKEELANKRFEGKFKITKSVKPIYDIAEKVASTDNVTVLILGETGTGKEGLARFIHEKSSRSNGHFKAINCSAMSDQLLESRLFGYKKGAFTGAELDTKGYFQEANGGTIFLDEIGDISPYMQQVLLRVLQEKKITKIGSSIEENIDVRIIAATNQDLIKLCNKNKFRRDLYYRLSVVDLTLPSLKERGKEEIEEIFNFIVEKKKKEFNKPPLKFSHQIKQTLFNYSYPGNIRELENIIERFFTIVDENVTEDSLPKNFIEPLQKHSLKLSDVENRHIKKIYEMTKKNGQETRRILGISYNTLKTKLTGIYGNKLLKN